ncbi:protein, SNF2 family, partial [Ancylostoma caninum]
GEEAHSEGEEAHSREEHEISVDSPASSHRVSDPDEACQDSLIGQGDGPGVKAFEVDEPVFSYGAQDRKSDGIPFASTPRSDRIPKAPSWTQDALSPRRHPLESKSNPDHSRSFIASNDSAGPMSPHSLKLASDPNQQGRLRDRLMRKSIAKRREEEEQRPERSRTVQLGWGNYHLNNTSPVKPSSNQSPSVGDVIEESITEPVQSDGDDDIIVLDSDAEDEVHQPRKDNLGVSLSRLPPEVITIDSSDEDEIPKAPSGSGQSPLRSNEESEAPSRSARSPSQPEEVRRLPSPSEKVSSKFKGESTSALEERLRTCRNLLSRGLPLPDGGQLLRKQINDIESELEIRKKFPPEENEVIVDKVIGAMDQFLHINPEQFNKRPRNVNDVLIEAQRPFARSIQEKALQELHKALLSQPDQTHLTETPEGLTCPLKEHQKSGLTWLLWRESVAPGGGILADEMGLGKTLSMIALIVAAKAERKLRRREGRDEKDKERRRKIKEEGLVPSNATLIVAPAALIYHWEAEIKQRCEDGLLKVVMYHSNSRKNIFFDSIARADVVITTYTLLANEIEKGSKNERARPRSQSEKRSPIEEIHWARIVLDEAHQIKNKSTKTSRAVCRLEADARWCVTGTPLHNNLWDLYSLMRFLKVEYFCEEKYWKDYVTTASKKSAERLNLLMKTYVLRREKNFISSVSGQKLVELPPKHLEDHFVEFEAAERTAYDIMFKASRQRVQQLLTEDQGEELSRHLKKSKAADAVPPPRNPFIGSSSGEHDTNFRKMGCMLVMLLRLRQACIHFRLTKNAVDLEAFQSIDAENPLTTEIEAQLANMTIDSVVEKESIEDVTFIFKRRFVSAKRFFFLRGPANFLSFRQSRVDRFNARKGEIDIMLVSITAGGVGLNLTGGNHLILMDLHWNPALELQASDRVHRMGQTKDVYIHKLIMKNSIEERVLDLQKKKMELAESVLRGAVSKKAMNLTLADLRFLFNLDGSS